MVQEGYSVLMMDTDIIFRKSPIPHLMALMEEPEYKHLDFVGQWTGRGADPKSPINTGFVFFRSTQRTKTFTQTLRNAIAIRPEQSDQLYFNTILRHKDFSFLNFEMFHSEKFYKRGSHAKHIPEKKIMYHAVGPGKQKKFGLYNDWYLNKNCSFYKFFKDDGK